MSYENAPQTALVATHCAICARPLCDAESVEAGIGPVCREKVGMTSITDDATRRVANQIVWQVAVCRLEVCDAVAQLRTLGLGRLAHCVEIGSTTPQVVKIEKCNGGYMVRTPFNRGFIDALRNIRGRRWISNEKANFVPNRGRKQLWRILCEKFAGATLQAKGQKSEIPSISANWHG